jgi:enoyl-CoA hydratase
MPTVLFDRDDGVVTLTLNRPEKHNALNEEVLRELAGALVSLQNDGSVRAAIVAGSGDKAFAAGADIAAMVEMTPMQAKAFSDAGHHVGSLIEQARFAVIAAVQGFALGGGCELALACDFIYASEKAKFGEPEVTLGVIPGFGGSQRLARRVGVARAREMCMTGDFVGAEEALRIGLVNAVVPHDQLMTKVHEVAKRIAAQGPLAIASVKRAILRGIDAPLTTANELEAAAFAALFGTADQREGMNAFLAKRPPKFVGA